MAQQIITKTCRTCKKTKVIFEFYKHRRNKDGHKSECKECQRAYAQTPKGKEIHRRSSSKYRYSQKGKRYRENYEKTEHGQIVIRRAKLKYARSEHGKAKMKQYRITPEGKKAQQRAYLNFLKKHPHQIKANTVLNHAIRDGKIPNIKLFSCKICGNPAEQYHHHKGYDPKHYLDVIPLCRDCHQKKTWVKAI